MKKNYVETGTLTKFQRLYDMSTPIKFCTKENYLQYGKYSTICDLNVLQGNESVSANAKKLFTS